jgi:hypothetical protein
VHERIVLTRLGEDHLMLWVTLNRIFGKCLKYHRSILLGQFAYGRWILWADDDELERLKQLRHHGLSSSGMTAPTELTTPKLRADI